MRTNGPLPFAREPDGVIAGAHELHAPVGANPITPRSGMTCGGVKVSAGHSFSA